MICVLAVALSRRGTIGSLDELSPEPLAWERLCGLELLVWWACYGNHSYLVLEARKRLEVVGDGWVLGT